MAVTKHFLAVRKLFATFSCGKKIFHYNQGIVKIIEIVVTQKVKHSALCVDRSLSVVHTLCNSALCFFYIA